MGRAASREGGRRCWGQHTGPFLIVLSSPKAQGISGATQHIPPLLPPPQPTCFVIGCLHGSPQVQGSKEGAGCRGEAWWPQMAFLIIGSTQSL